MKTIARLLAVALTLMTLQATSMACETVNIRVSGNLDPSSPQVAGLPPSDNSIADQITAAQVSSSVLGYDSLGASHAFTILFYHTDLASPWIVRILIDAQEVGGTPGQPYLIADAYLDFEPDGLRVGAGDPDVSAPLQWTNGSQVNRIRFSFPVTQLPSAFSVTATQDGSSGVCAQRGHLDWDGDGSDDLVVWRRQSAMWAVLLSSSGYTEYLWKQWGLPGDYPMAGDYTGDGKADLVVWRPNNGNWYTCESESNFNCNLGTARQFGLPGDRPLRGDFDGDTILDLAVWRPNVGMFFYLSSRTNEVVMRQWGLPGDIPLDAGVSR